MGSSLGRERDIGLEGGTGEFCAPSTYVISASLGYSSGGVVGLVFVPLLNSTCSLPLPRPIVLLSSTDTNTQQAKLYVQTQVHT